MYGDFPRARIVQKRGAVNVSNAHPFNLRFGAPGPYARCFAGGGGGGGLDYEPIWGDVFYYRLSRNYYSAFNPRHLQSVFTGK